jgi:hypothetical protein
MKYIPILLFACSCALFNPEPKLSDSAGETPEWIYSPYSACTESEELCASGEAKAQSEADALARNNLASIFEVKVKSEFTAQMSTAQGFPWQGAVREEVQKSLQESVDQILETVQIKKRFKKKGLTYSLASLDRDKASELLRGRLNKIDTELETLWARKSRTNLRKIVRLFLEREKVNERYSIVAKQGKLPPIEYRDILAWRESRPKFVPLVLRVGQAPEWMTEKLKELLTESGFQIVKGNSERMVSLNVDSIKEFLNVDGFEKYTFTLNLTSYENGEKKKVLSTSETVTGRNQADALLKVKTYFNDYIENHLSDLHLD